MESIPGMPKSTWKFGLLYYRLSLSSSTSSASRIRGREILIQYFKFAVVVTFMLIGLNGFKIICLLFVIRTVPFTFSGTELVALAAAESEYLAQALVQSSNFSGESTRQYPISKVHDCSQLTGIDSTSLASCL